MRNAPLLALCALVFSLLWYSNTFATNNPYPGETRCGIIIGNKFHYATGGSWYDLDTRDIPKVNGNCSWVNQGTWCGFANINNQTQTLYTHKWTCVTNVPLDEKSILLVIAVAFIGYLFIYKKMVYT